MKQAVILVASLGVLIGTHGATWKKAGPHYFPGGRSKISSSDPARAKEAIQKWSNKDAWTKENPEASPYFWNFDAVGHDMYIRVLKNGNFTGSLEVWLENVRTKKFELFKRYRVAFHSGDPGPKTNPDDKQAPEGFYFIRQSRMKATSRNHLSMDIGYPNAYDRLQGRSGTPLMIHGKAVSRGGYAMTDASIEQIDTLVDAALKNGQPIVRVHCFPFAMTEEAMEQHRESEHFPFWNNLKEGWDHFERTKRPPDVDAEDGRYVYSDS